MATYDVSTKVDDDDDLDNRHPTTKGRRGSTQPLARYYYTYKVSEAVQRGPKTPQWQHTTCQPKMTTMMTLTRDTQPRNGARGPHNPSRGITLRVQGKYSGPGGPKNPNRQHTTMTASTRDTQPRNDAGGPHSPWQGITMHTR